MLFPHYDFKLMNTKVQRTTSTIGPSEESVNATLALAEVCALTAILTLLCFSVMICLYVDVFNGNGRE